MRLRPILYVISPVLAITLAIGCGASHDTSPAPTAATTATGNEVNAAASRVTNAPADGSVVSDASAPVAVAPTPPPPPPPPVSITAGTRRVVPAPTPRVRIVFPANGATVREDHVEVRLAVEHWRNVADAADHRHIHLILDDNPYIRVDDPTHCGDVCNLQHLSEGTHVLRAFPGWDTHESVKTEGAFAMVVFHVGHTTDIHFNPHAPLLTYSRPKGDYTGPDADNILLDWYLTNIPEHDIGEHGFRVRPTIDGTALPELTSWVPYTIHNLQDGDHTIVLDLLDREGHPVPGPFNHAERHIGVHHNAPATDPHAGH